ncbi:hypothetical protein AYJ66_17230 [Dietzia cinnamea]|nr:hypothetical protein AYJ66_17230 [Dietzia cinnamea]
MFEQVVCEEFCHVGLDFFDDGFVLEHCVISTASGTVIVHHYLKLFFWSYIMTFMSELNHSFSNRFSNIEDIVNTFPHIIVVMLWLGLREVWVYNDFTVIDHKITGRTLKSILHILP